MTASNENATHLKSPPKKATPPKSRNSDPPVQIQIKTKFQFEIVPQDTEGSEFHDLVDFGGVAFSVEMSYYFT